MKLELPGTPHLTYCTNVHRGESWAQVRHHLETILPAVKVRVSPAAPMGVGLWLSNRACEELEAAGGVTPLRGVLEAHDLYVFTMNGFPFGDFHQRVKETVYVPDWRDERRHAYSRRLSQWLAELLPAGTEGSVSTVPGAFKPGLPAGAEVEIASALVAHAAFLHRLFETSGRTVTLALEPEPCCLLETVEETTAFFARHLHGDAAVREVARQTGLPSHRAEAVLRRHLGVCFDACHSAVQFERPRDALAALRRAGVRVCKVQLSSALDVSVTPQSLDALASFGDDVYLHQVVERRASTLRRFVDLPQALQAPPGEPAQWRVHFHVPVFLPAAGALGTTQRELKELLAAVREEAVAPHLEVETYTWAVLPEALRHGSVVDDVVRELAWVRGELQP